MYKTRNTDRLARLLRQNRKIFKIADLSILWDSKNRNTLTTTIKRYKERGLLFDIKKGVYSIVPIEQLHPYELGCALCGYLSYVTTETILEKEGIIMQPTQAITLMGLKRQEFNKAGKRFLCRRLNEKFLINRMGIEDKDVYSVANTTRSVADMRHVSKKYFLDNTMGFSIDEVVSVEKLIGYT